MLASAAHRVKNKPIYATGGNDNTVGIWDLTDISLEQDELPKIGNGTIDNLLPSITIAKRKMLTPNLQMKWSTAWQSL